MDLDLLLCNPLVVAEDPTERRILQPYFPLGLLYLAGVARAAGYRVAIFDGAFVTNLEAEFTAALEHHRPRVVGVAALNTTRKQATRLGRLARRSGAFTLLGGPDPTASPEIYLLPPDGGLAPADALALGEAEETLLDILAHLGSGRPRAPARDLLGDVPGVAFLDPAGQVVRTGERPLITDLDALPFPARDLVDLEAYQAVWRRHHGYSSLSLLTARGCPFKCTWCAKPVFGRRYRQHSPARAAAEMRAIKDAYHPDQIRIVDDILPLNKKWLAAWRAEVERLDATIPFECLSRVDLVDEPTLRTMKAIGCRKIYFGAESGSQRVLDAMKKGIRVEETYAAARLMKQFGLESYFFIMLGYPPEDRSDIELTVKMLKETLPDDFSMTVAYPLPGTEFYDLVRDRLAPNHDWEHSAENRMLWRHERYGTAFYRWAQRLVHREVSAARVRAGQRPGGRLTLARLAAEAAVCRAMLWAHEAAPALAARWTRAGARWGWT